MNSSYTSSLLTSLLISIAFFSISCASPQQVEVQNVSASVSYKNITTQQPASAQQSIASSPQKHNQSEPPKTVQSVLESRKDKNPTLASIRQGAYRLLPNQPHHVYKDSSGNWHVILPPDTPYSLSIGGKRLEQLEQPIVITNPNGSLDVQAPLYMSFDIRVSGTGKVLFSKISDDTSSSTIKFGDQPENKD
ncbi:hypothetical protein JD969_04210 [Planctomycetota bacterium]|nr:hypothetical protein JD969_04210 [Planctomycetota bacterium]